MVASLRHRGPDDQGIIAFDNCILGHTRLSIVDLCSGHQPMVSDREDCAITFNGEIYGYRDIREEIKGYCFKTNSDTEVILALYKKFGEDMMSHLPGMFAFAIWDETSGKLFCARDRFGEKPLYYAFGSSGEFIFASEIKALLSSGLITPEISMKAVSFYLRRSYVHPSETIYKNIHVLPPGYLMSYQGGRVSLGNYWKFPKSDYSFGMDEAAEVLRELFEQAVRKQLMADVPVSAFLSGGLDSTTIVAVASNYRKNLKTFSFGFDGDLSELRYAGEAARKFGTDHYELIEEREVTGDLLVEMQNIYDEPFGDSSNIPTYLISKLARRYGKVVLTGDGADELMAGYTWLYNPLLLLERSYNKYLWKLLLAYIYGKIMRRTGKTRRNLLSYVRKGLTYRNEFRSVFSAHKAQNTYFNNQELLGLGVSEVKEDGPTWELTNTVDDALRTDLSVYMPGDILVKTDRASMANGLELRAPFLDVRLAEFCISLPSSLKINQDADKLLLRRAYSELWPPLIKGRAKQGFGAPVSEWLRKDSFRSLKQQYLERRKNDIYELIPYDKAKSFVERDNHQTWILLVLSMWIGKNKFALRESPSRAPSVNRLQE